MLIQANKANKANKAIGTSCCYHNTNTSSKLPILLDITISQSGLSYNYKTQVRTFSSN